MLTQILAGEQLYSLFQPIVGLDHGRIMGFEALTRGAVSGPLASPRGLFTEAARVGLTTELDRCCWKMALASAGTQIDSRSASARLFLNVLPETLANPTFLRDTRAMLAAVQLDATQVVIEVTEDTPIRDYVAFQETVNSYRAAGFGIAVDDAGAGHSGLQMIAEIVPDFVKIDAGLIREIDRHRARRATVQSLVHLASALSIVVIAEGIERPEELTTLRQLGVPFGQGYLLGRPQKAMVSAVLDERLFAVPEGLHHHRADATGQTIAELAERCPTIAVGNMLAEAVAMFDQRMGDGIVVLDGTAPVGLLMKSHAFQLLGRAFGRELYYRRPVERAANDHPLVVDAGCHLEEVARMAMARLPESLYDHLIVTRQELLVGVVSVQRLLAAITDSRVEAARHANPLTGLPGNAVIEREIKARLNGDIPIALLHLDLDDFKVFNDVYGFHRGDEAITLTATLIADGIATLNRPGQFLGHIGGDDFLAIVDADVAPHLAATLAGDFAERIQTLYDPPDVDRGHVVGRSRTGETAHFPLMTLSVAISCIAPGDPRHYAELLDSLSAAKRAAKLRKLETRTLRRAATA